jgi:ubiquinone/menaquinone biosynthesis C-methylase UbiE
MAGARTVDRYLGVAGGWAARASRVYGPIARDLVAAVPQPLAGATALDAGAGTGLVGDALAAAGAHPVALDLSLDMLRWRRTERPLAVCGEVGRIPLRTGAVDAALAAFVLNHLRDQGSALRELTRVTRRGGHMLATVFANSSRSAIRDRVDEVAVAHGFRFPDWFVEMQEVFAPRLGTVESMVAAAERAGLTDVDAEEYAADLGLDRAADLVDYRYSQAHCRGWISRLSDQQRERLRAEAIAAIEPVMEPYRPRVIRLVASVP